MATKTIDEKEAKILQMTHFKVVSKNADLFGGYEPFRLGDCYCDVACQPTCQAACQGPGACQLICEVEYQICEGY